MTITARDMIGTAEAADILGVCKVTVQRMIRRGDLPARRFGNRYLLNPSDVATHQWPTAGGAHDR